VKLFTIFTLKRPLSTKKMD